MPPQRIHANELGKLLNSARWPIYVLDDDLTIVFLNRACHEWLGAAAEGLLGRQCTYQSSPAVVGPEAVAAGLCPPPQSLSGGVFDATVARVADDGTIVERHARFLPLGDGDDFLGVVAVVDPLDKPPVSAADDVSAAVASAAVEPSEAIALHEHVRRFRQEAAARHRADGLIGQGPAMRLARRRVELAAASRASVLLVGPPGSGRRHLAAAIHYGGVEKGMEKESQSGRHAPERPSLVPLDCSLLADDLLTTAAAAIARGASTLLLHRVDELTPDVQAQLADLFGAKAGRRPPDRHGGGIAGGAFAAGQLPPRFGRDALHHHDRVAAAGPTARRSAAVGANVSRRAQRGGGAAARWLLDRRDGSARRLRLARKSRRTVASGRRVVSAGGRARNRR